MAITLQRSGCHALAVALITILTLASCRTVPVTGRKALSFLPESQMQAMGADAFAQIKQKERLSEDPQARRRVERVGRRIAQVAWPATGVVAEQWELVTFASEQKNAFALPGGRVGVYEGILAIADTDEELATVMGHEVAHVAARHGSERMSQALLVSLGGMGLSAALREKPAQTRQLFLAAFGLGAQVGYLLPHSRQQELEADRIGLIYMARAGYDPRASIDFWQAMEAATEEGQPPTFLSTHPGHGQRIDRLREYMPQAMAEYRRAWGEMERKGQGPSLEAGSGNRQP